MITECPVTGNKCNRNCMKICEFDDLANEIVPILARMVAAKNIDIGQPLAQNMVTRFDDMNLDEETRDRILGRAIVQLSIQVGKTLGLSNEEIANRFAKNFLG